MLLLSGEAGDCNEGCKNPASHPLCVSFFHWLTRDFGDRWQPFQGSALRHRLWHRPSHWTANVARSAFYSRG